MHTAAAAPAPQACTAPKNDAHYHFPLHRTNEPEVGAHVMYVDQGVFRNALVQIVFTEHGMPSITLVMVRGGSRGGLQTKNVVPHLSKRVKSEACWCLPTEVLR